MQGSWFVLYGQPLAWVMLSLFLGGSWLASEASLRVRAWRSGRARRKFFGRAVGGPFEADHVVTLKGRLELRGAPCRSFEDGGAVAIASVRGQTRAATVRGEHLVLSGAQTVLLEGPLEVLVGSRQSARSVRAGRLRRATAERVGSVLPVHPTEPLWFGSLRHGDPVWVQGRLAPGSDPGTLGIEWRLKAEAEVMPVLYRGVPRVFHRGWWRIPVATMAALVLYFGLAKLAYTSGAYELAAATPYRRLALQGLRDRYADAAGHDRGAVDALELVQRARGDHCQLQSRLRELGWLDRAVRVSSQCDESAERDALALCLVRRGRFNDASALLDSTPKRRGKLYPGVDLAVNVHFLANRPDRALSRLEYLSQLDPVPGISAEASNEAKTRTQCLRLALRSQLTHDPEALPMLRRLRESPAAEYACTVLYADLVQGEERLHALESCAACRTKYGMLALPWLLGVKAACPRSQEESPRCQEWLLRAKSALRHPQGDDGQPLAWISSIVPAVESEVSRYLMEAPNHAQPLTDARTWIRDRMGVFSSMTQPAPLRALSPLLDALARARSQGDPLPEVARDQLRDVLSHWAAEGRTTSGDLPPSMRKVSFEQGTCYRPRGWYEREFDPRRTLASLVGSARTLDVNERPEAVGELWIVIRSLTAALNERAVAVPLMALHQ